MNLAEALLQTNRFNELELKSIGRAFEVVGSIGILEFRALGETDKQISIGKKKIAAKTLLSLHKNIQTVIEKTKDVSGKYRVPKYKFLAGKKTTTTMHKENGCMFKVNLAKSYFSSKLGSERLRIANLVQPKENVLVMFAGVGTFAINIAKRKKNASIVAVEINPNAVKDFKENLKLNKVDSQIQIIKGDVKKILPKLNKNQKFDRIVMPAPHNAMDFLDLAMGRINPYGLIHVYTFAHETEIPSGVVSTITEKCKQLGKNIRISEVRKCGDISSYYYRVVADVHVLS